MCHVSGMLNRHNLRMWDSENSHKTEKNRVDIPEVNVWCEIMHDKILDHFSLPKTNHGSN